MPATEKNAAECSDSALMLLFSDGELEGFEQLYERHKDAIFRFFYFGTNGDEELSAELFQDVWLTIVRGRKRFTKEISFVDWLRHVAWARLYDHLRMYPLVERPRFDAGEVQSNVVSLSERLKLKKQTSIVGSAPYDSTGLLGRIKDLSDEQCEIVLLRYCFRMDLGEISSFLDVTRTAVSQLHDEAVASLRQALPEAV